MYEGLRPMTTPADLTSAKVPEDTVDKRAAARAAIGRITRLWEGKI
jgi:hypothetical protein